MAQWSDYITNMEASGVQISGVFSLEGQPYAVSNKLNTNQQEMAVALQNVKSNNFSNGLVVGGKKYTVINSDSSHVTAKCRTADKEDEKYLMHISLSNQVAILGGMCGPSERNAPGIVDNLVQHLKNSNS